MNNLIEFFRYDYIAMLGLVVLIGSFFLLALTIKSLSSAAPQKGRKASADEEESSGKEAPASGDEMALLETYLRSISDDLTEIKQRITTLEETKGSAPAPTEDLLSSFKAQIENQVKELSASSGGPADPAKLNKDLQEIKLRLSAIHKIISNLAEQ